MGTSAPAALRPLKLGVLRLGNRRVPDNFLFEATNTPRCLACLHQLVSDILNRELDLSLREGLEPLARHEPRNWVVKLLHPARETGGSRGWA